ncbi:hypothetical protein LMIY3S_03554 [Labrys miyagiensis]
MLNSDLKTLGIGLREAMAGGQLQLGYQPQVNLADRSLHALEALTRWAHPTVGDVPADRFIAAAEQEGLIEEIGLWALGEACRQWSEWRSSGWLVPAIAVNVSPLQFRDPDLLDRILGLLRRFGVPNQSLVLEVTEGAALDDDPAILTTMTAIRAKGVGLSMDDFGIGYSSLRRLLNLPVSELKIDQCFTSRIETDERARAIIAATTQMGRRLGITVIAEGVETVRQSELLLELDCHVGQGYLFSRSLAPQGIERWLTGADA